MAQKITQEQISQMVSFYDSLKTYSAVAKQMGISAATVSKYIKAQQSVKSYENVTCAAAKPISEIHYSDIISFSELTPAEIESEQKWIKEFHP